MNTMTTSLTPTWLSLVAETAGVAGASVTRVKLKASGARGVVRAIVQVLDQQGRVVGASVWVGDGIDLVCGTYVDLGCDFSALDGLHIVAWLTSILDQQPASRALAPAFASRPFDPYVPTTLELRGGEPEVVNQRAPRKTAVHSIWAVPEAA
jgi:hypothetical protein